MDFSLRPASNEDIDFLFQLHTLTLKPYVTALWGWDELWQRANHLERFSPEQTQIIQVDGKDTGVLVVCYEEDELIISLIEIHPDLQGKGLGTSVLKFVQSQAKSQQKPVRLRVLVNNPARTLYERLGFKVTESTDTHHMMICHIS